MTEDVDPCSQQEACLEMGRGVAGGGLTCRVLGKMCHPFWP